MSEYSERLRKWATKVQEMARADKLPPDADSIPWSAMVLDVCDELARAEALAAERLEVLRTAQAKQERMRAFLEQERERVDTAREVLRSLKERGPCPVCGSEGECAPDCRLAAALGRASGAGGG